MEGAGIYISTVLLTSRASYMRPVEETIGRVFTPLSVVAGSHRPRSTDDAFLDAGLNVKRIPLLPSGPPEELPTIFLA